MRKEFRKLLIDCEITQKDLAKKIGVCQATVNRWSAGKNDPTLKQTTKVAKVLNVDVEKVLACFIDKEKEAMQ